MEVAKKPEKQRYFLDTEFIDRSAVDFKIELISIAVIAEDDREYYGVLDEFNPHLLEDPWLHEHVVPKLPPQDEWVSMDHIQNGIMELFQPAEMIEIWARNGFYDHFIICKLFGGLGDLKQRLAKEKEVTKIVFRDTHELRRRYGESTLPELPDDMIHSALYDARHEKAEFDDWLSRAEEQDV